ncbi:STAS domain-containing protein [Actinoplanes sp. NEAU-A12]|uniref:STAS domain-containing protein n=1 Tax=Actinoplanes sandaracinus TaxID=3045177 RepID=A0ABT6WSH6_9ACTN|nr:STAS domain-containing protein [Actinoplanes sandaracinus]MDI6102692.1 STAS domain-containing protein [Actinoplanes sandaracinus]
MFGDRTVRLPSDYSSDGRWGRAAAGLSSMTNSGPQEFHRPFPVGHDAGEGVRSVAEGSHPQRRADEDVATETPGVNLDGVWVSDAAAWSGGAASLTVREDRNRVTIGLTGEIHAANARSLQTRLRDLINAHAAQHVVIDLARVEFCDLAGLRVLLGTQQYAIGHAVSCEFVRPAPSVVYLTRLLYGETSPLGVD